MNAFVLGIRRAPPTSNPAYGRLEAADREHRSLVLGDGMRLLLPREAVSDIHFRRDGDLALVLNGYLTQVPGQNRVSDQQSALKSLLRAIAASGPGELPAVARAMNGSFSVVVVNLASGEVQGISDKLGSRPLWHATTDGLLVIGNNPIDLARFTRPTEIDAGALASLLLYETQLDPTRCLLRGIRGQRQASILTFGKDGIASESPWHQHRFAPEEGRTDADWLDEASELLKQSAARLLLTTERPMVFFSGGVDSRLAAAAIVAVNGRPRLVTLADAENIEVQVARAAAKALRCEHEVVLRDPEYYLRALLVSGRSQHATHCWVHAHFSAAFRAQQKSHGIKEAVLGDHLEAFNKLMCGVDADQQALFSEDEFVARFDDLLPTGYAPIDRDRTLKLLNADVRRFAEGELKQNIRRRYSTCRCATNHPALLVDFFTAWQQTSGLSTFMMYHDVRSVGSERNVMFNRGLLDLLERMPARMRGSRRLGSRLVHRLHPQAGRVPDANSMVPLTWPWYLHRMSRRMRPVLGKIKRLFFSDTYRTTASWPHLPLLMQRHDGWKHEIESLLHDPADLGRAVLLESRPG